MLLCLILGLFSCGPVPCRQNLLRAFLDKYAEEVLKWAHPTARFRSAALLEPNVLQVRYVSVLPGTAKEEGLLTVRFQMSDDYLKITGLAANDTGSVAPFAMSDYSKFMALLSPVLGPEEQQSLSQYSPSQFTARYFNQKWQNYSATFPCK